MTRMRERLTVFGFALFVVVAIVGGAFLPPLMGLLADASHSVLIGFLVPLAAILYITWVAVANLKRPAESR